MAHSSKVPKFGEWENGDNVAYTTLFDTTRKGKSGRGSSTTNRNELPSMTSSNEEMQKQSRPKSSSSSSSRVPKFENPRNDKKNSNLVSNEPLMNRDVRPGGNKIEPVVMLSRKENTSSRSNNDPPPRGSGRGRGGDGGGSSSSMGGGKSDQQKRGRGPAPAPRPNYGGRGPSVPQFGNWNAPEADNYTVVFNKIKDSRRSDGDPAADIVTSGSNYNQTMTPPQEKQRRKHGFCSCFG